MGIVPENVKVQLLQQSPRPVKIEIQLASQHVAPQVKGNKAGSGRFQVSLHNLCFKSNHFIYPHWLSPGFCVNFTLGSKSFHMNNAAMRAGLNNGGRLIL